MDSSDIRSIRFDAVEQKYLTALFGQMHERCAGFDKKQQAWAYLAMKVKSENKYSKLERDLLSHAVELILSSGEKLMAETGDNLEAKIRAGTVSSVFKAIKRQLDDLPKE